MTRAAGLRLKPVFKLGERVLILDEQVLGHCRTPWYLRGRTGEVIGIQGTFRDPRRLAYHLPGLPEQVLYKVRFRQVDVWSTYTGPETDHVEADIYEPWLVRIRAAPVRKPSRKRS